MDNITLILGLADKIMDHIPNLEERTKRKYYKLKKRYLDEQQRENRDINSMLNYRDELYQFLETLIKAF